MQLSADLKNLLIKHVYEDNNGFFWLSTNQGLLRWQPFTEKPTIYDYKDGLLSNHVHAAYPDSKNRLWLSTNKGISCLNLSTNKITNYTQADGLPNNEMNYLAHSQGPDGKIYFGGIDGFVSFDPNAIVEKRTYLPNLFIRDLSSLENDGSLIPINIVHNYLDETYTFTSKSIEQQIAFSLPYYGLDPLEVEWRISNADSIWRNIQFDNLSLRFSIPHGNSVLEIKVFPKANPSISIIYKIKLYKQIPFYLHWQFWFGIIVIGGFLIWGFIWFKTRKIMLQNKNLNTEIERQTIALKEQYQKILNQKKELEQVDMAKNQLFDNINHEFRTPLSIVRVQAEMAKEKLVDRPLLSDRMQSIIKETQNLTEMLDEIIDLSKMKLGALENNPSPALIHDLITRYFAQFYGLAEKKLINYVLTLSFDKDLVLNIDVKKLERIVVNLIGNALKYTPEMGSVHLKGLYINHCLNITVSDNGPGIASDELESIFERFYRGRSTSQQSVSGLGIGLALSKDYTLTMNGSLTAESDGTHGSTFILQIPAEIAFNTKATNPDFTLEHNTKVTVGQTGKKHHLLIVEDNIEILRYLQDILRNNYTITVATDGEQAWQTLNRDHSINLVVSDAMMPKVDGFTLLQKTRNNSSLSNMPFVMLTALASEDDRLNGLRFGVDAYLTKPFGITELRLTVSRLLSQQEERKLYVAQEKGMQEDDVDQTGSRNDLIGFDKEWLEKLENIVFDNLANFQFKVPDMAILIGNSERSLFDKLKVLTGLTPSEYLKKARLNRAMELIKLKKLKTIKEITHAIGLQDARSFSAAFKEEFGRSPKDYLAGVDDNFPL